MKLSLLPVGSSDTPSLLDSSRSPKRSCYLSTRKHSLLHHLWSSPERMISWRLPNLPQERLLCQVPGSLRWYRSFQYNIKHLDPRQFQDALLNWITSLHKVTAGRHRDRWQNTRAKLRCSPTPACHSHGWASVNHISLQTVVEPRAEITAIQSPMLPEVTIDAMLQTAMAQTILDRDADYWKPENFASWYRSFL